MIDIQLILASEFTKELKVLPKGVIATSPHCQFRYDHAVLHRSGVTLWHSLIVFAALAVCTLPTTVSAESLQDYAAECNAKVGISVPKFNCDKGTLVPTTNLANGKCDRPNQLHQECDPGSRFQVLPTTNAEAFAVAHCRKQGLAEGHYGDIAVITHNMRNGATCFFQSLGDHDGTDVHPPDEGTNNFWLTPAETRDEKCGGCHDNGAVIRSPYLTQVKNVAPNNALPGSGDISFNSSSQPYCFVGTDFANWKAFKVEVEGNICITCHRMGVNNVSPGGGTARDFGIRATAMSQTNKNPHSANSPMWMLLGETAFDPAHFAAAQEIRDCANQFDEHKPLPSSSSCKITQFAGSCEQRWETLGGTLTSPPAVSSRGAHKLDVFVRATDGALYHKLWNGSTWSNWESLGGELKEGSAPAAVSWSEDRIDVFVRWVDDQLHHKFWRKRHGWSNWESLGGTLTSSPAVSSRGTNRLDVFVRATDGSLYHRLWNGNHWSNWDPRGGFLQENAAIGAVSWSSNRIDVFVEGGIDHHLYQLTWNGNQWGGFHDRGGELTSGPAVSSWNTGRLDVFVRATDGSIYKKHYWSGSWSGWSSLGGHTPDNSAPAAVSWGNDRIDVFIQQTPDNGLYHRYWDNGPQWKPN